MIKVGILGGSFDPIHLGHITIIQEAMKQLELDYFLVIPTKHNPWKDSNAASSKHRVAMLEIALSSLSDVGINTIEMDSPSDDKSYTINTLETLKTNHPNYSFYYIMGMDQASQFHKWKGAKEISEMVQLVAFDRLGYQVNENIDTYNFIKLEIVPSDISSSAIRAGEIKYLDPKVLQYITNHGLYLETMLASKMSEKRFIHTKSMAHLAREIAVANGLDDKKAYIAGMFHDITKEMSEVQARPLMEQYFASYVNKPMVIWHQWLSAYIAERDYYITDPEILQAIRHHTTASIHMSKLDMCIYVADKYDLSRNYDASKEIELCKENVVAGFKQCLKDFYEFSKEKNREIDSCFFEVYNTFVEEKLDE